MSRRLPSFCDQVVGGVHGTIANANQQNALSRHVVLFGVFELNRMNDLACEGLLTRKLGKPWRPVMTTANAAIWRQVSDLVVIHEVFNVNTPKLVVVSDRHERRPDPCQLGSSNLFNLENLMTKLDAIKELVLVDIGFSVIVDVRMVHVFDHFFGKRKVRETVLILGHVDMSETHYTIVLFPEPP